MSPAASGAAPGVLERIRQNALVDPSRPALLAGDERCTYGELAPAVAGIAAALDEAARGPLGVWAGPGVEATTLLLGALCSRHPVVLLEPAAPDDLLRRRLDAAGADDVVAPAGPLTEASARTGRRGLRVAGAGDGPAPPRPPVSGAGLLLPGGGGGSGASRRPAADLSRQAAADAAAASLHDDDRVAVLVPRSGLVGVRALLAPLHAGATVGLPDAASGPLDLAPWLASLAPTAAGDTALRLLAALPAPPLPGVRVVVLLDGGPGEADGAGDATVVAGRQVAPSAAVVAPPEIDPLPPLPSPPPAAPAPAPPTDPVAAALAAIWEELLGVGPVPTDRDFFALGGHSLLAARMLVLLEQRTGVRLPMAVFLDATTVDELAEAAAAARAGRGPGADSIVVPLRAGADPALAPLFLTHDLQGSAFRFRPLAEAVGGPWAVHGFESPFLTGRVAATSIGELADRYVTSMRAVQPAGPYHLAGYSFGGVLAFEMASALRRAGEAVALLGVIDVGPGYRGLDYSRTRLPPLPYVDDAAHHADGRLPRWAAPARRVALDHRVLARRWQRRLARGEAVPPDERLWPAWWSHWRLVGPSWAPSPYDGRVDLFWAETTLGTDATMGWGAVAPEVVVHPLAGRHEALMAHPAVEAIGAGLRARLEAGATRP